ncbi:hypothetical protein ACIBLB_26120 [Streptosporangium canum]|uniref:hypothetical protein n=1 Tax=Streptosporangium canum TaxID=324952 RepID=UPI0037A1CEBC
MSVREFSADEVAATREGWVLAKALVPEGFDDYLTHVEHALQDPRFVALIKRATEAASCADQRHTPGLVHIPEAEILRLSPCSPDGRRAVPGRKLA